MQGISWLFNAFRPQPQRPGAKPAAKPTPKPKEEEELLTKQPTHITPVVDTTPSRAKLLNSLSEDDLQKIIRQLEEIQKDPSSAGKLDLSPLKNLQAVNNNAAPAASNQLESVQIISPGTAGSRSRHPTRSPQREETTVRSRGRKATTTSAPVSVTNEVYDVGVVQTSERPKLSLPPVQLTPVPGVPPRSDPKVRGQLINAAVNVTKAISSFLGTALQV